MTVRHTPLRVSYIGALGDLSGYAAASRDYVHALDTVDVDVAAEGCTFEPWKSQKLVEEIIDRRLYGLMTKPTANPISIIHLTPDNYGKYKDKGIYRIGYFAWETSALPKAWVPSINDHVHEVWVPCEKLRQVTIESGVDKPVLTLPHAVPLPPEEETPSCTFPGIPKDPFKFYSVFQWSERKNPVGLIKAYYEEFSKKDDVVLVLKTYRTRDVRQERDFIRREIASLKRGTKGINCPPIVLIEEFLSNSGLREVHKICDCYVSMSRSEGFGIPPFVAASYGNGVIVPNNWGFADHFTNENSWLVDVPREIPIRDMRHISVLYTGNMFWGDPSVESCRFAMREAYSNQDLLKRKASAGKRYISEHLSYQRIGERMKARLETVQKELLLRGTR